MELLLYLLKYIFTLSLALAASERVQIIIVGVFDPLCVLLTRGRIRSVRRAAQASCVVGPSIGREW